jgi:TonB-linked SusC/RagA family outer membrane protein
MQVFATSKTTGITSTGPILTSLLTKYRQAVRIMKLTGIILLAGCLQLSARGLTQTVSISVKDAPLLTVLKAIEKQTDFVFFINKKQLEKTRSVSITANNAPLLQVLDQCFKNQPLAYSITGKVINVFPKEEKVGLQNLSFSGATNIDVKGRVINENGDPVLATITIKGTNRGTTTKDDGEFLLKDVAEDAVLVISGVGVEGREIKLTSKNYITITVKIAVSPLDEVQMIAYGTTTKRFNTGNIVSVKSSEIGKQPVNNPLLTLQGRVPGLIIEQSTGLPGSGITVRIQGQNSISRGNDPFYVIDGVPFSMQLLPRLNNIQCSSGASTLNDIPGNGSPQGNPLSYLNPQDIESIEILKDADATAIYGSRAANGAILITTKKGKAGETQANVKFQSGWGKVTRMVDLMNTEQYIAMRKQAFINDGLPVPTASTTPANGNYDLTIWDQNRYTDWQKVLIGGTAKYTDGQVNISGGNSSTQFLIGTNYHRETSVFPGEFSDRRGSVHFNLNNTSFKQRLKIQLTGNYLIDDNELPTTDFTSIAVTLAPNAPALYNPDGSFNWEPVTIGSSIKSSWYNPLGKYLMPKYLNKTKNLVSNALISYQVIPGLEIKGSFGYTNLQNDETITNPLIAFAPEFRSTLKSSANYANGNISSWIIEPQITYKKSIGNGKLELLMGSTFQEQKTNREQFSGSDYLTDDLLENIKAAATVTAGATIFSTYRYNAIFFRANYNFKNRYVVNVSARRDGSSRFGSENLFNNFWSVGGAWIFSEEKLIKSNLSIVSFGKIRASYGTTGNDQIGDYSFLNSYNLISPGSSNIAYQGAVGLTPAGLSNPYLAWEETKKFQIGIDIGLFNDKVVLNTTYYRNRSSNQLLSYRLPLITGFNSIYANFPATVQNTGLELLLTTNNIKKNNFSWNTSINFTLPNNKLISFPGLESSSYANSLFIGKSINVFPVYKFDGVDPTTGLYQFFASDGSVTSSPNSSNDRFVLINRSPKFYGGFQNSITYKNFQLDVLFQFVKQDGKNYLLGSTPGTFFGTSNLGNQPASVLNAWQKNEDKTDIQKYSSSYPSNVRNPFNYATSSDKSNSDASYVRLKNVSLSYQLPYQWLRRIFMKQCQLFIQGQNLLTITNYPGIDPENKNPGSLPPLRVLTVGVQVTF